MRKPKVLVLDIETAPILAWIWDLKINGYVPAQHIKQDRYVLAWGAKWLGSKKVIYKDQRGKGPLQDKQLLKDLWPLLDEADIVITYNGEGFDLPRIVARMQIHGIKPFSPVRHYDVMKLMKRVANHTSNTLDYIATHVNKVYKKLHHVDFPGLALWLACMSEVHKAWQSMKKYNIHDVLSTEEACVNTVAWAPDTFPEFYPVSDRAHDCGRCGRHGFMRSTTSKLNKHSEVEQFRCEGCGAFQLGKRIK